MFPGLFTLCLNVKDLTGRPEDGARTAHRQLLNIGAEGACMKAFQTEILETFTSEEFN